MKKTSKSRRRLNVIDVLIIMLVIALLATVGYRIYAQITDNSGDKKSDYVVVFESDEEYRAMIGALKKNDKVYFCSDGVLMGYLYDKNNDDKALIYEVSTQDDNSKNDELYEKISFGGMIALSAQADKVKGSDYLVIGDRNISVGSRIEVYTEKATFTITVKSIAKLK